MKHPLLNEESKHYQMFDGIEAIERLEQMFTNDELATWAKITAMKYRLRIGHKDHSDKEVQKIKTFENYYKFLTGALDKTGSLFDELEPTDEEAEMLKKMGDTSTNFMGNRVSGDGACPDEEAGINKKTRTLEECIVMLEVRNAKCGDTVDMKDVSPARFAEMLAEDEQ